jgi:hypothetical protein
MSFLFLKKKVGAFLKEILNPTFPKFHAAKKGISFQKELYMAICQVD